MEYTQCVVIRGPPWSALQGVPDAQRALPPVCPVFSWLLPQLGAHLRGGWLSPALGLVTTPSTCPHPGAHPAVPVTKGQLAWPYSAPPRSPLGLPRETSTISDTGTEFSTSTLEPWNLILCFKMKENRNILQEETQPCRETSCQLHESLRGTGAG